MKVIPEKLNVSKILTNHWLTFGDVNGKGKFSDWISFYAMPLLLTITYGVKLFFNEWPAIPSAGWNAVITVTSILIPLMLAMLASLIRITEQDNKRFCRLVKELIYNSSYGILVSVLLLSVSLVAVVLGKNYLRHMSLLFVFFTSHLFLTLVMIIKRFYKVAVRIEDSKDVKTDVHSGTHA